VRTAHGVLRTTECGCSVARNGGEGLSPKVKSTPPPAQVAILVNVLACIMIVLAAYYNFNTVWWGDDYL
jgi:hypothetical protein